MFLSALLRSAAFSLAYSYYGKDLSYFSLVPALPPAKDCSSAKTLKWSVHEYFCNSAPVLGLFRFSMKGIWPSVEAFCALLAKQRVFILGCIQ